jgi:hypothetical protein
MSGASEQKNPDGLWPDQETPAGYESSTTSSQKSLFDTGNLDMDPTTGGLTVDYGSHPATGITKHLPAGDVAYAEAHGRSPTIALTPDDFEALLQRPIALFSKDKKKFLQFQQMLFMAGFYGSASAESVHFGSPTPATQMAWLHLLEATQMAQKSGRNVTPDELLEQAVTGAKAAAGTRPAPPLILEHADPKDVAGMLQRAAQDALGRDLSDAEVAHFISSYRAQEDAFSRSRYTAQNATTGTFNVTAPDLESQAKSFVKSGHQAEATQQTDADYIGALEQMIGGL